VSRDTDPLRFGGTAFLVQVPYDDQYGALHIVTAKHVADAVGANCIIAMNGKDGHPLYAKSDSSQWFFHPTEADSVDAAVLPFATTRTDEYDISPIPLGIFATEKRIAEYGIGLGDEVFSVGLFTKYFGKTSLVPIVRTGNLAMIPRERIPLNTFGLADAYLVEGRSIGGLSGSPVFCRDTLKMPGVNEQGQVKHVAGLGQIHLLGLIHGHWDLPVDFSDSERAEAVNMGISIVIPAKKIVEILFSPALVLARQQAFERSKD
jgi:hypothetical protein